MYRRLLCRLLCAEYSRLCNLSTCCGLLQPRGGSLLSSITCQCYFWQQIEQACQVLLDKGKPTVFMVIKKNITERYVVILFCHFKVLPGAAAHRWQMPLDKTIFDSKNVALQRLRDGTSYAPFKAWRGGGSPLSVTTCQDSYWWQVKQACQILLDKIIFW